MTFIHDQTLPVGAKIGIFEVKEIIEVSNFNITYHGWNHHLKKRVDILEYFPYELADRTDNDQGVKPKTAVEKENFICGLKAFLDQAAVLTQLKHPNIASTESVVQFNDTAYLIINHQEGVSLANLALTPISFSETKIRFILVSILNALQEIHGHNTIHGNIQPKTIWMNKNDDPILVDMAAAQLAIATRINRLTDELATGYAPAESYKLASMPGPTADFYGLAATLYYCMTHIQPTHALQRVTAINEGKPDPVVPLEKFPGIVYSQELTQIIDWMLKPQSADRPQSVSEILTLLKSQPIDDSSPQINTPQERQDIVKNRSTADKLTWVVIVAGVTALVAAVIWLSEDDSDQANSEATNTSQTTIDQSPAVTSAPPNLQPVPAIKTADDKHVEEELAATIMDSPESKPEIESVPENTVTSELDTEINKQPAVVDQSISETTVDETMIKAHLAAAENALKRDRLTTPPRDNAFEYYQMILAMEPDNTDALTGLQKIVDRYIQLIKRAQTNDQPNRVKRYLQRAESVLPNDPALQELRNTVVTVSE